jgi:hypothetical protein
MNDTIELTDGMIQLEPTELLSQAIIGTQDDRIVYSLHLLIEAFMSEYDMDFDDALEWADRNIIDVPMKGWPIIKHDI